MHANVADDLLSVYSRKRIGQGPILVALQQQRSWCDCRCTDALYLYVATQVWTEPVDDDPVEAINVTSVKCRVWLEWRFRVRIGNSGAMHFSAYPYAYISPTIWVLAQHWHSSTWYLHYFHLTTTIKFQQTFSKNMGVGFGEKQVENNYVIMNKCLTNVNIVRNAVYLWHRIR